MELFVISPNLRFTNPTVALGSTVSDLIEHLSVKEGVSFTDFYVKSNGRVSQSNELLQSGVVYRVEPRLCGGKGGFGSMLRALGAQIEKTTNREACRDLSGRRLRDVNHEKEMAEWLKKQADREAEKEQRRLERIQRKLAEPKHYFTDTNYEQQCHDLSERLEDSVLKGLALEDWRTWAALMKEVRTATARPLHPPLGLHVVQTLPNQWCRLLAPEGVRGQSLRTSPAAPAAPPPRVPHRAPQHRWRRRRCRRRPKKSVQLKPAKTPAQKRINRRSRPQKHQASQPRPVRHRKRRRDRWICFL
uniref:SDE2 telomere maintenance homolog (S. pombe) n=1 Tax=Cyprinus carpio carpio TaxID=630221 RepID=A0A9J7YR18_CYPCA